MSAGWIAGSVRARLLLERRLGAEEARAVASCGSLKAALARLSGTAYARAAAGGGLEGAQRAVAAVTLLELRILAGWLPRSAAEVVRTLGAWYELANVEDRLVYLLGGRLHRPFELGALAVVWPRAARAQTPAELRDVLRNSVWGDPGGDRPEELQLFLRLAWARRVLAAAPEAEQWALAAAALLLTRQVLLGGAAPAGPSTPALGTGWRTASSLDDVRAALPARVAWPLAGLDSVDELWRAEAGWWRVVEREAEPLARGPREGRGVVVGTAALLGLDAVRVAAALGAAARGGGGAGREAFDALL